MVAYNFITQNYLQKVQFFTRESKFGDRAPRPGEVHTVNVAQDRADKLLKLFCLGRIGEYVCMYVCMYVLYVCMYVCA